MSKRVNEMTKDDLFTAEWFPYKFERFERSDRVAQMSLAEEGAYHRAIRLAWKEGSVSANPAVLAAKIQKRCTDKIAAVVLEMFEPMPDSPGRMIHPTLEEIRAEQKQKYLNRVKGGRAAQEAAAAAKAAKEKAEKEAIVNAANKDTSSISPAELEQQSISYKRLENIEDKEEEKRRDASPKAQPRKKGSRLPDQFFLTSEMKSYAAEKRPDIDIRIETEKFCNYYRSAPGQKGVKLNWDLTWKNWILNANQYGTNRKNSKRTDAEVFAESADFYANYNEQPIA